MTTEPETILPVPKYAIGDRVYFVSTNLTHKRLPCPDCLGSKKWRVVSPAGIECSTDCPRCKRMFSDLPSLDVPCYESCVRSLTIGSIQINTADYDGEPVKYMCVETGVGSGSVYKESALFADGTEAGIYADAKVAAETAVVQAAPEATKARDFSYLPIEAACTKALWDVVFNSWYAYGNLIENLEEFLKEDSGDSVEKIKEYIRREVDWEKESRQPTSSHPFDVLIRVAKKHSDDPEIAKALEPFTEASASLR